MNRAIKNAVLGILAVFLWHFCALETFAQSNASPITIDGAAYFSIDALSRQKGFQFQWDPILKNAVVMSSSGFVKFHADSEYILGPQGVVKLRDKVRYFQGEIMAPLSATPYFDQITPSVPTVSLGVPSHRIRKVVIDPGHGGYDLGAISPSGINEKELALKIARMIVLEISKMGVEVTMTRHSDVFIPLSERSKIANEKQADLFISIHANASPSRSLKGFEVYYLSQASDDMAVALENAENATSLGTAQVAGPTKGVKAIYLDLEASENRRESIHAAQDIATAVQESVVIGARRVKSAQFHVLKWTECSAILIEMGYLTNPEDERRLNDSRYQEELSRAIARGFLNYKIEFEKTNGFTQ